MFSKEESVRLRREFWTSFGKSFPRKWLLYNTRIKNFAFKFVANKKEALVCLDMDSKNQELKAYYYNKLLSLKNLLKNEYITNIIFDDSYVLENGKEICRIYIKLEGQFSIHNKNSWQKCYDFFTKNMNQFELFFSEYEDFIKS